MGLKWSLSRYRESLDQTIEYDTGEVGIEIFPIGTAEWTWSMAL